VVKVDEADVPLKMQPPLRLLVKLMVLAIGTKSWQVTVIFDGAIIVGKAAGLTVIVLLTEVIVLEQASMAVQVSVTVPPQTPGVVVKVELSEVPLSSHPPLNPLL
jgi:hypothetical protein